MANPIDLTGMRFGKLTVKRFNGSILTSYGKKVRTWECECDCGNTLIVRAGTLKSGFCKSCGCERTYNKGNTKHNLNGTRIYRTWNSMKRRCNNPNCKDYPRYGGRGIRVCKEWSDNFLSFYEWALENGYSDELTIERIDVNGNYEPTNCKWITMLEQARNKGNTRLFSIDGESKTLMEWCNLYHVDHQLVRSRIYRGKWEIERALTTPSRRKKA